MHGYSHVPMSESFENIYTYLTPMTIKMHILMEMRLFKSEVNILLESPQLLYFIHGDSERCAQDYSSGSCRSENSEFLAPFENLRYQNSIETLKYIILF